MTSAPTLDRPQHNDADADPVGASSLDRRRRTLATSVGLVAGGLAFFVTLLDWSRDITRTAIAPGYFSHFFDLQARAMLDGHLWVPDGSLGIEGFIHDGRTYTYFPPWPAILRLPVLLTTKEYDARLTVLSMTIAWIVLAVVVTKLVWLLIRLVTGSPTVSRTQAALAGVFLAGATGGTFLTYDASLPWVYHEVYIWAVTASIGAIYWMIRVLVAPDRHSIKWLFVFALIAVGSRATEGLAIGLVVIAIGIFMRFRPTTPEHRRLWWLILLAGAVPLAISIAINEIKFGTPYMFPLKDQVWTQLSQQRRDALAANGGTLTGPQFFTTSFMAYLRPDGIRFVDYFPWITLPAEAAPAYNGAVVDQTYRTGSVTSFMPVFMVLEAVALVAVLRPRASQLMRHLRWPMAAGILITGGVMAYGYYANRYTSEFVPALVLGAAISTALLARWLPGRSKKVAVPLIAVLAAGVTFSMLAHTATGFAASAFNYRGEKLERYIGLQHRISAPQQAARTSLIEGLPEGGQTDDLAISGNCEALYINTGDKYEPWLPVQERDRVLRLSYEVGELTSGTLRLVNVVTDRADTLDLQINTRRQMRFVVTQGGEVTRSAYFDPPTEGGVSIGIRNLTDYSVYQFDTSVEGVVGYLPSFYLNATQDNLPSALDVPNDKSALARLGLAMTDRPGLPLELCNTLARSARLDLPSDDR